MNKDKSNEEIESKEELVTLLKASPAESVKFTKEDADWLNQKPRGKEAI